MSKASPQSDPASETVAGVALSNPDRVLYPSMGTTKRDLARYLVAAAPRLLPQLAGRPVSLVRCPQGREKACFFQKHGTQGFPDAFGSVAVTEKDGEQKDYLLVESEGALAACAQVGVLELHVWGSRRDDLERPDRLVFDLDPGEGIGFGELRQAAKDLAAVLEEVGLRSFPLVTGGKGIHLVAPLVRRHPWPAVSAFAAGFAKAMAEREPERYVATMAKAKRSQRIFIDYLRNQRGSTAIAPYSPRARPGAPLAMPVGWAELEGLSSGAAFSILDGPGRLKREDPWADYDGLRQSLSAAKLERIGLKGLL